MAFAAPYAPTVYGASYGASPYDAAAYGAPVFGGVPTYGAAPFGYDATPYAVAPTQFVSAPQPVVAAPTVAYTQSAVPVGPGYPINLREGDFWNPAANTVFDRLVGTAAGKGALYNNQQKRGLAGLFAKKSNPETRPTVPVAGVAPGAVPVGPFVQGPVAPGPGPVVVPPTANTVYQPSPYGYGPVATPVEPGPYGPGVVPATKGKKQKGVLAQLPTLAQVEALDVMQYRQPIIGAPVPAGPPLAVTQAYPTAYPAQYGAYPAGYAAY